ncbi:LysR family transcriptional regulator [Tatumella citrea]|uniref:LysR family transcriptional regulator n=1 Tax=Tatumella citrea TaxID=53336 RepID=A0A1Y0L7G9_TATCI|nr:LysR family transcriptional regulator [Tatumella citrea]ARU93982.1 LysR family transcriptional regulator [Tatumella citrea]ARU98020.1 LysR family transcriptional regulator [Tatumella citrea]
MSRTHDRLDWNLLRTFLAIVQEKSISKAAIRLHLTQPAVSLALKRLEEQLDEALILRNGSSFSLTAAGELVYKEALTIYGTLARLSVAVQDTPKDLTGTVRLCSVSAVQSTILDDAMAEFHQQHPRVTFDISSGSSSDVQHALLHYQAALGIALKHRYIPGIADMPLLAQNYYLYCGKSHRLSGLRQITTDDLTHEHFVSFSGDQPDGVLAPLTSFRIRYNLQGTTRGVSPDIHEVIRMIRCGLGIGALPEHVVKHEETQGQLWRLPPYEGVAKVTLYLMWNEVLKMNKAEHAFLCFLREKITSASG